MSEASIIIVIWIFLTGHLWCLQSTIENARDEILKEIRKNRKDL